MLHPVSGRPLAVLVLFAALVVLLLRGGVVSADSITVADLQTEGEYPVIRVAQVMPQSAGAGKNDIVFEEPAVLVPDAQPQPADAYDDGCSSQVRGNELPLVAIIIDDMGYHQRLGESLLALEMNLTYSFLPHAPFSRDQMEKAGQKGHDILLHMPMEALDPVLDPGPGTLYLADPIAELSRKVAQNLASVPGAIGINNHMGSRFTEDREAMKRFFKLLAGQDFLFIDSGTSSQSVAMETARTMGFRTARRHVFLDNVQTQDDICRQLKLLVKEARKRGLAIGIGHPNEATLAALTRCRVALLNQVRLVGIHELVR